MNFIHFLTIAGGILDSLPASVNAYEEHSAHGSSLGYEVSFSPFKLWINSASERMKNVESLVLLGKAIDFYHFDPSESLYLNATCHDKLPYLRDDLKSTDDFLLYLVDKRMGKDKGQLESKTCASAGKRPLASLITLNSDTEFSLHALKQEILYLLGFSLDMLLNNEIFDVETENSDRVTVATPDLMETARKMFNCPDLKALELIPQPQGRLKWAIDNLDKEEEDRVHEILTLALLQDSGRYWIKWDLVEIPSNLNIECPVIAKTARKLQTCTSEIANCSDCNEEGKCIECNSGYFVKNGACSTCSSSIKYCKICSQDGKKCYACSPWSYYVDKPNRCGRYYYIGNCRTVSPYEKRCLSCHNSYYVNDNGFCSKCDSLTPNCVYCIGNPNVCFACQTGYYMVENECMSCNEKFKHCEDCGHEGLKCLHCEDGYFLSKDLCLPCSIHHNHCKDCSREGSTCLVCMDGYYMKDESTCSSCDDFAENCMQCSVDSGCLRYYPGSLYVSGTESIKCSEKIPYCDECIDENQCSKCNNEGYMVNGLCLSCESKFKDCQRCDRSGNSCYLCKHGFYKDTNGNCQTCSSAKNHCLECSSDGTECLLCEIGYYKNGNVCSDCDKIISNCDECSESTCYSCKLGYYLKDGGCYPCYFNHQNCKVCSNDGSECIFCEDGYYNDNNTCRRCNNGYCALCDNSRHTCTSCKKGFYASRGSCRRCSDSFTGAETCDSSGIIYTCLKGYVKKDERCYRCSDLFHKGCDHCDLNTCFECADGYYPTETGCKGCNSLHWNCQICSKDGSQCLKCDNHLFPDGNQCSSCPAQIENCSSCKKDGSECYLCEDGFYWNEEKCDGCANAITGCTLCTKDGKICINCAENLCPSEDGTTCGVC